MVLGAGIANWSCPGIAVLRNEGSQPRLLQNLFWLLLGAGVQLLQIALKLSLVFLCFTGAGVNPHISDIHSSSLLPMV